MFFVYVLFSSKFGRFYVGMTNDMERRLAEHNNKKMSSTKAYVPWKIIHVEKLLSRREARDREKYLKSAAGRRWRNKNIRPRGATE